MRPCPIRKGQRQVCGTSAVGRWSSAWGCRVKGAVTVSRSLVGAMRSPMRIVIAQMRVERELAKNRETICSLLQRAQPEDWVVFPEGALTGYFPDETDYLVATEREDVDAALAGLRALVERRRCRCLVGTARFVAGGWRNSAALISPAGEVRWYDKHTLGSLDSRHFAAGDELSVYAVDGVNAGVQICWSCCFPGSGRS